MHKIFVSKSEQFFDFYNVKMTADYCNFAFETVYVDQDMEESKQF